MAHLLKQRRADVTDIGIVLDDKNDACRLRRNFVRVSSRDGRCRLGRLRKVESERRTPVRLRRDGYPSSGTSCETVDLRQAETRTFSMLLRGEEGLENTPDILSRDSHAGVADRDCDVLPLELVFAAVHPAIFSPNRQCPARRHGVARIDRQIYQCELEFVGIRKCR